MSNSKSNLLIYILLAAAVLMVFWQVNHGEFIDYDDDVYVTANPYVQDGLTVEGIRWALTTNYNANWHPLTWMSHMLDVQLFGLNAGRHHTINLLFHLANTLLLFFVFNRMTLAPWKSAFVAALFALHPLHVESVAWIAERKDVLSSFFWMLTMATYVFYVEKKGLKRYLFVLLFFILGLMSKPMLVTLPFVLLLMDYWPLRRLIPSQGEAQGTRGPVGESLPADKRKGKTKKRQTAKELPEPKLAMTDVKTNPTFSWAVIRPLLWEKIPLFVLVIISSIATYIVQQEGGAMKYLETLSLADRIANAIVSYAMYIGKALWPSDLAMLYPHSGPWPLWEVLGVGLALVFLSLSVIWKVKKFPYLASGWFWYVGTLVPVIGFIQVGVQARADRYTYIPLIGLFIMAAWGIPELLKKMHYRKETLWGLGVVSILSLAIASQQQVGFWQNSIKLFDHTLQVTRHNSVIHNNRGARHDYLGNYKQALDVYDKAIEINPKFAEAYCNRGNTHINLGNYKQALDDYGKAIEINPKYTKAYYNRGNTRSSLGDYRQALDDYDKAIEINPGNDYVYFNRGAVYYKLGDYRQAIDNFQAAAKLGNKDAQKNLGKLGIN